MLMDEPTNHLDMESIESLNLALENYPGTLIFVSHDREFVSSLATRIIELTPTGIVDFHGTYEDYLRSQDIEQAKYKSKHHANRHHCREKYRHFCRCAEYLLHHSPGLWPPVQLPKTLAKNKFAEGEIVSATAYAIHRNDDKQLKFQDALKHIGFTVKLKPYIQRSDGSAKGDWDVGIAPSTSWKRQKTLIPSYYYQVTGTSTCCLKKIKKDYAVSAEVYGVPALTANSLIDAASIFHRIEEDLLL